MLGFQPVFWHTEISDLEAQMSEAVSITPEVLQGLLVVFGLLGMAAGFAMGAIFVWFMTRWSK